MKLSQRILNLERTAEANTPVMPGRVIFCNGETPTEAQQQEIDEAKANGQPVIIFKVVDASSSPHGAV